MKPDIYLGYDPIHQRSIICWNGRWLEIDDHNCGERAAEVINGLIAVGTKIKDEVSEKEDVTVVVRSPFQYQVEWSEQAWSDLQSIGVAI